jgi:PhoPQ-activated pathogenicity-related protein
MEHRALQLILPFEPALPDRPLILAPRLWPTMTPRARQQLAKRLAHLLRSALIAADARKLSGGPQYEHAAQFGKPGNDGTSRQAGLHLRAAVDRRSSPPVIEDPYSYRERLTMPKYIVNSAGDQYFLPDSSQFYFDGLRGEKYLRYLPNTDHSLKGSYRDAAESALAFYQSILTNTPRPRFAWGFEQDGSIRVKTETRPNIVTLWQAHNPDARDFRLETIGRAFTSSILTDLGDGLYVGMVPKPKEGWTAYFVEMTFSGPGSYPYKFTTEVGVTPDLLPFGPPPEIEQGMTRSTPTNER